MKRGAITRFVPLTLWGSSLLGAVMTAMGALASYGPEDRLQAAITIHCSDLRAYWPDSPSFAAHETHGSGSMHRLSVWRRSGWHTMPGNVRRGT